MMKLLFLVLLYCFTIASTATTTYGGLQPKIVGGRLARRGEFPFQVSLQDIKTEHHFCGGSIINQNYVLTAAHCLTEKDIKEISVNVGTTDLTKPHSIYLVASSYIHEEYNASNSWINDIALLKLKTPFVFSSLVSPVPLPIQDQLVSDRAIGMVSGFGRLDLLGNSTKQLYVADIIIAKHKYCKDKYWDTSSIPIYPTQICAFDPVTRKGSCHGDSGGPLTVYGELIGIISWGSGCGDTKFPNVFTRVPSYINWINEHAV
ncbi:hypothetical protein P5V15_011987 [Pogonomyrmex californicus]